MAENTTSWRDCPQRRGTTRLHPVSPSRMYLARPHLAVSKCEWTVVRDNNNGAGMGDASDGIAEIRASEQSRRERGCTVLARYEYKAMQYKMEGRTRRRREDTGEGRQQVSGEDEK